MLRAFLRQVAMVCAAAQDAAVIGIDPHPPFENLLPGEGFAARLTIRRGAVK